MVQDHLMLIVHGIYGTHRKMAHIEECMERNAGPSYLIYVPTCNSTAYTKGLNWMASQRARCVFARNFVPFWTATHSFGSYPSSDFRWVASTRVTCPHSVMKRSRVSCLGCSL